MVSIYKCPLPQNNWEPFPKFGAQKPNFYQFLRFPHSTPHTSGTKRRIDKSKCYCQSTMFPVKADLPSVTFDPETAENRSVILTHPRKFSIFRHCYTYATVPRPTKFCPMLEGLRSLLSTVNILEKFVPKNLASSLS